MDGGKRDFNGVGEGSSPKLDYGTANSQRGKKIRVKRKTINRPPKFKADDWYAKASLSMAITKRP